MALRRWYNGVTVLFFTSLILRILKTSRSTHVDTGTKSRLTFSNPFTSCTEKEAARDGAYQRIPSLAQGENIVISRNRCYRPRR